MLNKFQALPKNRPNNTGRIKLNIYFFTIVFFHILAINFLIKAAPSAHAETMLTVGTVSVAENSTQASVPISLVNSSDVSAMNFDILYDNNTLSFVDATIGIAAQEANKAISYTSPEQDLLRFVIYENQTIINNGEVAVVNFNVLPGSDIGDYALDLSYATISDTNADNVPVVLSGGKISITTETPVPPQSGSQSTKDASDPLYSSSVAFVPQIALGEFRFSAAKNSINDLGLIAQYIQSLYSYLIGIAGIVTAVIIMFGGLIWLTAGGDAGKVKDAQSWIKGGIAGLTLIIISYTLLATINPALVTLNLSSVNNINSPAKPAEEVKKFPVLSQMVPGAESFSLGSLDCSDGQCSTTWIAQTVNGVYRYALGIVGIVAAVVLIIGGLFWMTAGGDAGKVSQAQDYIKGAVMGLVLVICSYTILYQLNPLLVDLQITGIARIEIFQITIDLGGGATVKYSDGTQQTFNNIEGLQVRGKSGTYMMQPGLAGELSYLGKNFGGLDVSSIFRTNSPNHITGDSADLPTSSNGNGKLLKIIDYYMQNPTKVRQLIYQDPNTGKQYGILNGKVTSNGQTGTYEFRNNYNGHKDHIHLSIY